MSKYIKTIPLGQIARMAIVPNPRGLTLEAAMGAQETEPDIGINGGFYTTLTTPVAHLKADGQVLAATRWSDWGYGWDAGSDIRMLSVPGGGGTDVSNHITCVPLLSPVDGIDAPLAVAPELAGKRGRTALALDGANLIVWVSSDGTDGITLPDLRQELYRMGTETALALDGGQSSKVRTRSGVYIDNKLRPAVANYIMIWLRPEPGEEDEPVDIVRDLMTKNKCCTNGRTIVPKGVMVHSTATPGVMAKALRDRWNDPDAEVSVHAMVDDTVTLQTLPWTARAWHCADDGNNTHIAFEVCEPQECRLIPIEWDTLKRGSKGWAVTRLQKELVARGYDPKGIDGSFGAGCEAALRACQKDLGLTADGKCGKGTLKALAKREGSFMAYDPSDTQEYFEAVWSRAVALTAHLCREFNLDPDTGVLSHAEGHARGIANNHADVGHWWPLHGKSMDDFRAAVKAAMKTVTCPECGATIRI